MPLPKRRLTPLRLFVALAALVLLALIVFMVAPAAADHTPPPSVVNIPGSFQSELGCPGDWLPDCAATYLAYDASDDVWQGTFSVPAGDWEYKAALNNGWDENYGLHAIPGGANIPLSLAAQTDVKFYYDHKSHWITDNAGSVIAVAPGSFQSEIGCPGDWQPDCLRSWLEDVDGDGLYTFTTTGIPAGTYEAKVALDEGWSVNYGDGCALNGANIAFSVPHDGAEVYFAYDSVTHCTTISAAGAPRGDLGLAKALWVTGDTIAWNAAGGSANSYQLVYAADGGLTLEPGGIVGGTAISLTVDPAGLDPAVRDKFPYIAGYDALKLDPQDLARVPEILKGEIAIQALDADANLVDATSMQIQGVLDDLYTYEGALGVTYDSGVPTLSLWAPTAKTVALHLFDDPTTTVSTTVSMTRDESGVWQAVGTADWTGKYYLYDVEVYVRGTGQVEHNLVTDPYSISLSMNSLRSQIVDLTDPALKPAGWDDVTKPDFGSSNNISVYELHVRDFSVNDPSVPDAEKGKFVAFTESNSNGMNHLRALAEAGLTHIHLLPVFDIASVNEDPGQRQEPDWSVLASYPPDSDQQQAIVNQTRDQDAFNWGYDPYHYTTPEGSYATTADGSARIVEFREMVEALNQAGLRVVMDVVYNHTSASGQDPKSVLDRVVPGYYHRLSTNGTIETSTCCQNTATEFNMMEKLMVDSLVTWATAYKVDGFRFDLMGHHMKRNMLKVRDTLAALTPAQNGVDGSQIYIYGEGWDFGEVTNNQRGVNATQLNMAGTGIGTFNDRLRDGARGGGPFSPLQDQGFISGLYYDPNATNQGTPAEQKDRLLHYMDLIRVGLAGNLQTYTFVDKDGNTVSGYQVDYNGAPAGYTLQPQENVVYDAAHDNETLFDAIQAKAALTDTVGERVRMQNLGIDVVALAQGIHFFHAGQDLLRSKSLDRNSYNSGDWFNKLDFTYQANNWGVGLPPAQDNQSAWPIIQPLLANPALTPGHADIEATATHFREMMQIRQSSTLFNLPSAGDVISRVTMFNTGPAQVPGLIVEFIADRVDGANLDPQFDSIGVFFNASNSDQTYNLAVTGRYVLHPLQAASSDPVVRQAHFDPTTGTFFVPARTTAVFVSYDPPQIEASITVTPGAAQAGEEVAVDVHNLNSGGPAFNLFEVVPLDTNLVQYVDGSVSGDAFPISLPLDRALALYRQGGRGALAAASAPNAAVVAIVWQGDQARGQAADFGFRVTVLPGAAGRGVTFDDLVYDRGELIASAQATLSVPALNSYQVALQNGANGYRGTRDTTINAWAPAANYGSAANLYVRQPQVKEILIDFDLTALPNLAQVTQARIGLYVTYGGGNPVTMTAYEVYKPWQEASATWTDAAAGLPWEVPGAMGPSDRASILSDRVAFGGSGRWVWLDVTSLARKWVAQPADNHGIVIVGSGYTNAELEITSADYVVGSVRPQMTLSYRAP